MQFAVEIRQLEIGSFKRAQRVAAFGCLRAEIPNAMLRVAGPRLAHLIGERAEVEEGRAVALRGEFALASRRNRHAQIAAADSLGLELPSSALLQLRRVEPQRIRVG